MLDKRKVIEYLRGCAVPGLLKTGTVEALERRIHLLNEIEMAAQEAREALEAAILDREEGGDHE